MSNNLQLTAYLDERFGWQADASAGLAAYPSTIAAAAFRMQVRPQDGSPVVLLDFLTGGSPQNAALTATYGAGPPAFVTFAAPTSVISTIPAGAYAFEYGFTLAGADYERLGGGTITFLPGAMAAGVVGTPAPPSGADPTVTSS